MRAIASSVARKRAASSSQSRASGSVGAMSRLAATAAVIPSAKTGQSQRLPRTTSSGIGMKSGAVINTAPMRPITKPSAPMTNVCRRKSPRNAIAAMRQKRSQA